MKKLFSIFIVLIISLSFFNITNANPIFRDTVEQNPYNQTCVGGDCLKEGVNSINNIEAIETERTASQYIQDIVKYILSFLALLAIIIIIYSGFNLLVGMGNEEKAKKTKDIIIYAIVGLVIIFLAGPIADFIFNVLNS